MSAVTPLSGMVRASGASGGSGASGASGSSGAFRAGHQPTEVLDRSRPLRFSFNGRPVAALGGDTIVSALMASGVRAYAQGRRLQHRRGVLSADRFDPSCVLQVDDEPNVPAAHRLAADRQQVRSQHVWPSLRFDLKSMNQRVGRLLRPTAELRPTTGTGFLRPAYRWVAARADVGGRLTQSGQGELRARHEHPDVLVVGAGLAGLAAAEAAAHAGARTLVVEADRQPGGWLRLGGDAEVVALLDRLEQLDVEVRTDSVVAHIDPDGVALVTTELAGGGEQLSVVVAGHVILATGLTERTLTFTGNDLPGVMLATGARRLVNLWAVRPGRRAVVLSANAHGDAAADELSRVGVEVAEILDARRGGVIRRGRGSAELEEVVTAKGRVVPADLLVVAAGWTVDAALVAAAGGRVVHDRAAGRPLAVGRPGAVGVVGALAGEAGLEEVTAHASVIGRQAAAAARRRRRARPIGGAGTASRPTSAAGGNVAASDAPAPSGAVRRAAPPLPPLGGVVRDATVAAVSVGVVDFAEDVTAFELYDPDPVTATRLLNRAAAAPAAGIRARAELVDLARRHPAAEDLAEPLLMERPGGTHHLSGGIRLGSLAWLVHHPVHRSALADEHLASGGRMELVDDWLDVAHYGRPEAERRALVEAVGVRDTGRSALFDIRGVAAAALVVLLVGEDDLPDVAAVRRLPGRPERPPIVVARPESQHFQVRADAADAARVEGRLLSLVHIEHRDWEVFVTSLGETDVGIALVGPAAPSVLPGPAAGTVGDLHDERLGATRIWHWQAASADVVELRVPAGRAVPAWREVLVRAAAYGGVPVGAEAAALVEGMS